MLPGARILHPGESTTVGEVTVEAVPAYNLNKFRSPGVPFHPKSAGHNGYIITVGGERLYHAGDTDHIPEMAGYRCDVALLPVSGTYVMTADEAAAAAPTSSRASPCRCTTAISWAARPMCSVSRSYARRPASPWSVV